MQITNMSSLRIDEEERAGDAVPAIFAERQSRVGRLRRPHGKAEAEPAVAAGKIEIVAGDSGFRPDMVRRHQRHRLGLEVALARPACRRSAASARTARSRPIVPTMPAPPDSQRRALHRIADAGDGADKAIVGHRLGDQRPLGLICDVKSGFGHAERIEQTLLLELEQRLSGHHLDDAAEDVGRMAVVPSAFPAVRRAAAWRGVRRNRHCRNRRRTDRRSHRAFERRSRRRSRK